jgi:rsbT co-antagonist protein RsbR
VATGGIVWSGETEQVCGMSVAELNGGIARWDEAIHPDDHARAMELLGEAEARVGQYDVEYRFRHKDGTYVMVANILVQAARAVRLLGARVILTGISAEIAQTLVGLGADLRSIETRATLQDGIALALQLKP